MKKLHLAILVSVIVGTSLFFNSCGTKKPACDCCNSFGARVSRIDTTSSGKIVTLIIPSAFTPNNIKFCDSNVYVNGVLSSKNCRDNVDSIYNDTLNQRFQIIGIESFPENDLIIRKPGDTTKIDHFINFKNKAERSFNGIKIDTTLFGSSSIHERQRQLVSGRYQFVLQLYRDSSKVHNKASRIDSICGYFCIIRTKDFCNLGCEGKDKPDPLIK
jgi:hypothetical protein